MKAILLTLCVLFIVCTSHAQGEKTNGTIYIEHPYITMVNKQMAAYLAHDAAGMKEMYADTAHIWLSGMPKTMTVGEALNMWSKDPQKYDSIQCVAYGYPDYLAYKKDNEKYVQSWWNWSGRSKKTGQLVQVSFVQFDQFNKDGKVAFEASYGDFSKMDQ